MSRLVTFGCSHTYGHGLEDCIIENNLPGPVASKFAWPNQLGTMLGLETINLSRPGASNLEILYNILKFDFQEKDVAVVLWTEHSRDLIFAKTDRALNYNLDFFPIGTWMTKENEGIDVEAWLSIHTDYDLLVRSFMYIHHAEKHLENKKIKNYSFFLNAKNILNQTPNFLTFNNLLNVELWDIMFSLHDKALDGCHPGPVAHIKIAEEIYKHINE